VTEENFSDYHYAVPAFPAGRSVLNKYFWNSFWN